MRRPPELSFVESHWAIGRDEHAASSHSGTGAGQRAESVVGAPHARRKRSSVAGMTAGQSAPDDEEPVRRPGSRPIADLLTGPIAIAIGLATLFVGFVVLITLCWYGAALLDVI